MIRCLIVDDEPFAIELIQKHIEVYENMKVVATCKNVREAINVLQLNSVDLIFLDVRMPDVTGIEFLEHMDSSPKVILTTAYREYAVKAYEYGVLDYLVKPISFLRFAKAMDRYTQLTGSNKEKEILAPIVVKSGSEYHKVMPDEIDYLKSVKEYVAIFCGSNKYLVRSSMAEMIDQLPYGKFIQTHKSYIVPLNKIKSITASEVVLTNNDRVPLGRSFIETVRSKFTS